MGSKSMTKISDQTVRRMEKNPPREGYLVEWDSEIRGFGVRITAGRVASFMLFYRIFGRQRNYTIGRSSEMSAAAARKKALELRTQINNGKDPAEEKQELSNQPTFAELLEEWLKSDELAKKRPNTLRDYRRMAEKILKPRLGKLRLQAITPRDISALHGELKETPYQANRVLALLSAIFTFAIEQEWMTENPARGVERYEEQKRDRYLNKDDPEEIARFTAALDKSDDQTAANALRLLLLTGSRLGEVLKASWDQFDLTRGIWTKPSHHTKQKKTEHVPLSAPALDLLERMKPLRAVGPLFPGKDGKKARVTIHRPWIQALKAAGLVEVVEVEGKRRGPDGKPRMLKQYRPLVRIHDLRHTFASHLASSGVSLQVIGRLIGHTQISTTQRYAHLQDESLRTATEQFGRIIAFPDRKKALIG